MRLTGDSSAGGVNRISNSRIENNTGGRYLIVSYSRLELIDTEALSNESEVYSLGMLLDGSTLQSNTFDLVSTKDLRSRARV